MLPKDFVIVDPCIREPGGHYAAYAAACRQGLEEAGHPTTCWVHRAVDASLASELHAIRVFAHDCWHQFNTTPKVRFLLDPLLAARDFLRDTRVARRTLAGETVFFAPTLDHRQLLAWAWWLRGRRPPRRAVLMLRYSFAHPSGRGWVRSAVWVRWALRLLRQVAPSRVYLTTDSRRLATEYEALGAPHVTVLPIPHTGVIRHRSTSAAAPRITMLGDARTEKGFAVLCEAILRLRAQGRVRDADFHVQANVQSPVYASLVADRERLRGLPGVTLYERALSSSEYHALLASADLVLLPYDQGIYRARTSGPFTEALAAGIPVVCTADTWMSDQLRSHGAGVACVSGDADALATAIERAVEHLPALSLEAQQRREAWVAFHSPSNFARVMREVLA